MEMRGPLLERPEVVHDLLSRILTSDPAIEKHIVIAETSRFPDSPKSFISVFREFISEKPTAHTDEELDDARLKAIYRQVQKSFDRRTEYRKLPGIGNSGAERLHIMLGGQEVPASPLLKRLAARHACDSQELCEHLSEATGLRPCTIAHVLITAVEKNMLDSRTGLEPITERAPKALEIPMQHSLFAPEQIDLFRF